MINQLIREIKIQMYMNHPNLIKLYSFFCDEYKIYLLMELAPDGQLYEYMCDGAPFSEESVSFLMRQTLLGVNYMHERHVIHRDIKPENIVLIHVNDSLLREYQKSVILVGQSTVQKNSDRLYVALHCTCPLKSCLEIHTTRRLTLGPLEL